MEKQYLLNFMILITAILLITVAVLFTGFYYLLLVPAMALIGWWFHNVKWFNT